jgi:hypothetical protein
MPTLSIFLPNAEQNRIRFVRISMDGIFVLDDYEYADSDC